MKRKMISVFLALLLLLGLAVSVSAAGVSSSGSDSFDVGETALICVAVGLVLGVIVALILKGQLKSVRRQNQANVYIKSGSMHLTVRNDLYLYRTVQKYKIQTNKSSR